MARLSISLTDEILKQLKETKPPHRPMSQHIADLLVKSLESKKLTEIYWKAVDETAYLDGSTSDPVKKVIAIQKRHGGLLR